VDPPGYPAPSPELDPEAVLAAVIAGLTARDRRQPEHGVAVVFAFASDRMRQGIGDLAAFHRALGSSRFAPLQSAARLESAEFLRRGDSARATVHASGRDGSRAGFTVALARAPHGERRGCWLLSGIARENADL